MDHITRFFSMLLLGAFLVNMIVNVLTPETAGPALSSSGLQNRERVAAQIDSN